MSLKTMPLLFINLGGEMMYILDQRLQAQKISRDKGDKVLHDIIGTMFNKRFMEELFKPQELYSRKAMRTVFDRLAHASIMRLNAASMDKLYDLMTMVYKYQISMCLQPQDILFVTLNHIDSIRVYVQDNPAVRSQVDNVFKLLIENYSKLSSSEFMLIRQTLLNFFQDMQTRVSFLLRDKQQNQNGQFVLKKSGQVPYGVDIPGTIKLYNERGQQAKQLSFQSGGSFTIKEKEGSVGLRGDRGTKLGISMYNASPTVEPIGRNTSRSPIVSDMEPTVPNPTVKAQLDLLSYLIGSEKKSKNNLKISLFNTEEEEAQATALYSSEDTQPSVVSIDASSKKQNAELRRIMGEMRVDTEDDGREDDLLDLLDSAR